MSRENCDVLKAHLEASVRSRRPISKLAFPSEHEGIYLNYGWWRKKIWYPALRKASVRPRTIHQIRHTFATRLLKNGEPLPYIKDQLGHTSIQLTVDTYGHLAAGYNRSAVDRLDE